MESIALYIEEGCHRAESIVNLTKKFTRASFKLCEALEILSLSGHTLKVVRDEENADRACL